MRTVIGWWCATRYQEERKVLTAAGAVDEPARAINAVWPGSGKDGIEFDTMALCSVHAGAALRHRLYLPRFGICERSAETRLPWSLGMKRTISSRELIISF